MPIEIKELHIKVTVNQPSTSPATLTKTPGSAQIRPEAEESLIAECVEKVLQVLKSKTER